MPWAERAADRSPSVQRSRSRSIEQARLIVAAAERLIETEGGAFTTQRLAKEAGVALQTFYRYFASKDELLLAVLEEKIVTGCETLRQEAGSWSEPLERLQFYITSGVRSLDATEGAADRRFVTSEHFRLHQLFPEELALVTRSFTELLLPEIETAAAAGLLAPNDIEHDAWHVTQLVMATFHFYSFTPTTESAAAVGDRLWGFCLAALGGRSDDG